MSGRITEAMVEAAARAMRPEWFTDDGSPPIVNNYPDQHVWIQEDARRAARAALEAALTLFQHQQAALPVEDGWMPIGYVEFNYARKLSSGRVTTLYAEKAQSTDVAVYVASSPAQGGR